MHTNTIPPRPYSAQLFENLFRYGAHPDNLRASLPGGFWIPFILLPLAAARTPRIT